MYTETYEYHMVLDLYDKHMMQTIWHMWHFACVDLGVQSDMLLLEYGVIKGNRDIKMFENNWCLRIIIINLWKIPTNA